MAVDFGSVGGVTVYPNGHFAMSEKSYLRWIDAAQVQDVVASGVYRVHRFDHASAGAPGNKLGLRCSNGNGDVVWAGLRQNFAETAGKATIVWAFRDNQHRILDTTPLSATGQNLGTDRQDGALAVGQTWVDPTQTLRITNLGGGGSSPNEYLDLQVSIVEVPSMEFFTTAGEITRGLTGSYVNANLRGSTDTDWTDGSKTISAARVDNPVKFPTSSWGARAAVGLTGGTDADWDDFSVQWDGYMRVRRKFLLGTISDDSSRMWIDRDGDGTFSAGELVNNNWGNGQGAVLGDLSPVLDPGLYRIRVQYEEGAGGNSFQFGINEFLFEAYTDTTFATRGLSAAYINSKLNGSSDLNWVDALQSGDIADSGASTLETTIEGPAWVSFWWKVSSESTWDPLVFRVNGTEQTRISGEIDWQRRTAILPAGPQTLRWLFTKDASVSAGADAGWLDEVVISDPSLRPQIIPGPGGGRRLRFTSQPGDTYALDHSTDLTVWTRILSEIPAGGTETVIDIPAPLAGQPAGFFRLGR